jgi:hypothetical protein
VNRGAKDVFAASFRSPLFQYVDGLRKIHRRDADSENVHPGNHARNVSQLNAAVFALVGQMFHDISPFSTGFG